MPDATTPRRLRRKLGVFGIVAAMSVAALVVTGIGSRDKNAAELRQWTETQAIPTVAIATLSSKPAAANLDLPGRLEACAGAHLCARQRLCEELGVDIG